VTAPRGGARVPRFLARPGPAAHDPPKKKATTDREQARKQGRCSLTPLPLSLPHPARVPVCVCVRARARGTPSKRTSSGPAPRHQAVPLARARAAREGAAPPPGPPAQGRPLLYPRPPPLPPPAHSPPVFRAPCPPCTGPPWLAQMPRTRPLAQAQTHPSGRPLYDTPPAQSNPRSKTVTHLRCFWALQPTAGQWCMSAGGHRARLAARSGAPGLSGAGPGARP
jgi:hypothetical protein